VESFHNRRLNETAVAISLCSSVVSAFGFAEESLAKGKSTFVGKTSSKASTKVDIFSTA
jgi:hypothetical protein